MDKAVLRAHIEDMLETRQKVTLKEVIDAYPLPARLAIQSRRIAGVAQLVDATDLS